MHIESLGDRIIDLLKSDFNRSTTFKQLYKKTGKHLNIIGTKMGSLDDKLEHFNHKKTPEMSIIDAIEISCALPFIFTEKIYNNVKYIDGCFVNELPIDMAEVTKSNKTLAIWIKSNNEQTSSLLNNIYNILTVSMNQLQYMRNKNVDRKYTDVIEIVADGVGFSDLNPSKKRQVEMWGVGYRQTEEFYSKIFMNGWEM
jgi:predicted acylesterase/phospholipase RssA